MSWTRDKSACGREPVTQTNRAQGNGQLSHWTLYQRIESGGQRKGSRRKRLAGSFEYCLVLDSGHGCDVVRRANGEK